MLDAFLPRFKTISFAAALRVSEAGRFRSLLKNLR